MWVSLRAIWADSTWNFKKPGIDYRDYLRTADPRQTHIRVTRKERQAFISLVEFGGIPSVYFRVNYLPGLHR